LSVNKAQSRPLNRPRTRLLSIAAGLAATLGASMISAGPADAAPAARVDLAEAVGTLPAAAELPPGDVTGFTETTVTQPTGLDPCNLADAQRFNLHDNGAAIGIYSTPANVPLSRLAQWVVSTRVFATSKGAHDAVTRLGIAEKACPSVAKANGMTFKRTWSAGYATASGWRGYHTVDVITIAGRKTRLRHIAVYLQRGNALIQVDEIAAVSGHNSAVQEARRLAVQRQLAARVSLAAAT
jgi:hypothetical protein